MYGRAANAIRFLGRLSPSEFASVAEGRVQARWYL